MSNAQGQKLEHQLAQTKRRLEVERVAWRDISEKLYAVRSAVNALEHSYRVATAGGRSDEMVALERDAERYRKLKAWLSELDFSELLQPGISPRFNDFDAAVDALDFQPESPNRKEEIRDMLYYEISQCPYCADNMRSAFLARKGSTWQECPKHREALRRLDQPEAE